MSSPDSQWSLELNTKANLGGVNNTKKAVQETTAETNKLTEATKRYNDAAESSAAIAQRNVRDYNNQVAAAERLAATNQRLRAQEALHAKNSPDQTREEKAAAIRKELETVNKELETLRLTRGKAMLDFFDPNSGGSGGGPPGSNPPGGGGGPPGLRGMSTLLSRIGNQLTGIAGLGRAMGDAFITGNLIAIGVLVNMANAIKEISDSIQTVSIDRLVDMMENVREKTFQTELATRSYFDQLKRIANRPETETQRAERLQRLMATTAAFEEATQNRLHTLAIQRIEQEEAAGLISHQDALRRKYQQEEEYQNKLAQLKIKAEADQYENKKKELAEEVAHKEALTKPQGDEKKSKFDQAKDAKIAADDRLEIEQEKLNQEKSTRDKLREKKQKDIDDIKDAENEIKAQDEAVGLTPDSKQQPGVKGQLSRAFSESLSPLAYAKLAAAQYSLKGDDAEANGNDRAIAKQIEKVHQAEEADRAATEAFQFLKTQVEALTESIAKLNIELPGLARQSAEHIAEAKAAAAAASAQHQAEAVSNEMAEEAKVGIGVGSAQSRLRYNIQQKRAWDAATPRQRLGMTPPGIEYDPNKVDAATGLPSNPGADRQKQPWEAGAQEQYNTQRYGNPSGGGVPTIGQLQALVEDLKQKLAAQEYSQSHSTTTNLANATATRDNILKLNEQISKITDEIKNISSRHYDTQVH